MLQKRGREIGWQSLGGRKKTKSRKTPEIGIFGAARG